MADFLFRGLIYRGASENIDKAHTDPNTGDRLMLPTLAEILSRFPKFSYYDR